MLKALVAQWIERLVAVQKVAGSIPAKRTKMIKCKQVLTLAGDQQTGIPAKRTNYKTFLLTFIFFPSIFRVNLS